MTPPTAPPTPQRQTGSVHRGSTIPLYHQLFLSLRDRIYGGEWHAGELFLRDADIEQAYEVSRITVRKAMDRLVDEGLVVRFRGKGTFVAAIPLPEPANANNARPPDFAAIDGEYTRKILEISKILVSKSTADRLRVPDNHMVSMLRLMHLGDGVPIGHEAIFVDNYKWPDIFDRKAVESEELGDIYQRRGMNVVQIQQSVTAVVPSAETSKLLALEPGQPVLFISRVGYARDRSPIDFRLMHCRADRFVLNQDIRPA
ncbi:MAG: GntR family transcriptional regulator [Alphaproteobacteria bacterium]|nr:GntR family transcriptional regulator [Alphaproteobacteria bacterium]